MKTSKAEIKATAVMDQTHAESDRLLPGIEAMTRRLIGATHANETVELSGDELRLVAACMSQVTGDIYMRRAQAVKTTLPQTPDKE